MGSAISRPAIRNTILTTRRPARPTCLRHAPGRRCGECYQKAQNDINFMRFNLEKLRTTCRQAENAADLAMKFGDLLIF